jgi:hypothetical protein
MVTMASPPIPTGQITAADLFGEMSAVRREVSAMLGRVDVLYYQHGDMSKVVADHESRLRVLSDKVPPDIAQRLAAVEKWQIKATVMASGVAAAVSLVVEYVVSLVAHMH